MEEKDKIIISTGHEAEERLETPHFDAEETLLAARPVVPLTEEAIEAAHSNARAKVAAPPLTRRIPILALVIIAAVSVGLAGGLAIGLYKGRQQKTTPVAAQPSGTTTTTTVDTRLQQPIEDRSKSPSTTVQTVADAQKSTEPVVVSQSDSGQIVVPEEVSETKANPRISDLPKPEKQAASDKKRTEERPDPPPATTRRKAQDLRADDDGGDNRQKLMRRRRAVERDRGDDNDAPRRIERAGQELNRIREIFEGARP